MSVSVYLQHDSYFLYDLINRHASNEILKKYADMHVVYVEEVNHSTKVMKRILTLP